MHTSKPFLALVAIVSMAALTGCTKKNMRQTSSSMEPTIKQGEVISVDLAAYSGSKPNRWDVIAFDSPIAGGGHWLGRIVGLPGEIVDIRSGGIVIDGKDVLLPAHLSLGGYQQPKKDLILRTPGPVSFPYKIPAASYFVLGDNVSNALDSRYWGGLDSSKILGKVPRK